MNILYAMRNLGLAVTIGVLLCGFTGTLLSCQIADNSFLSFPDDVHEAIAFLLDDNSFNALSRTCRRMFGICMHGPVVMDRFARILERLPSPVLEPLLCNCADPITIGRISCSRQVLLRHLVERGWCSKILDMNSLSANSLDNNGILPYVPDINQAKRLQFGVNTFRDWTLPQCVEEKIEGLNSGIISDTIPKIIYINGQPNNGKTTIAMTLARRLECPLLWQTQSFFYLGAQPMQNLFAYAQKIAYMAYFNEQSSYLQRFYQYCKSSLVKTMPKPIRPTMLILDDFDYVNDRRAYIRLGELLRCMTIYKNVLPVVVCADARGIFNKIFNVLKRASAFNVLMFNIEDPDEAERFEIFKLYMQQFINVSYMPKISHRGFDELVHKAQNSSIEGRKCCSFWLDLVQRTRGFTRTDLSRLFRRVQLLVINSCDQKLRQEHIECVLQAMLFERKS